MLITALDISLRVIAAAAAVGLVLVILRVRSGAARHAAWSAVLVAMLLMPLLTAIVPKVGVPVPQSLTLDLTGVAGDSAEDRVGSADLSDSLATSGGASALTGTGAPAVSSLPPSRTEASVATRLLPLLIAVYTVGLLVFVVRIALGWHLARRLVAGAAPVALTNPAPVLESAAVTTPLTTGVFSPTVLLPVEWREWPADKLAAVLAHENAHIVRRDALVAFLAQVNRALFWFHPLAWWLERTLAVTAEHACDEAAARQIGQPQRYAEVLLDMAEAVSVRGHRVSWQTIGVDGSGVLGARIDRILKGDVLARMSGVRRIGVAVGCAAVLILAIACRQQIAAEPLRPDPEVQKQIDENKARGERHKAAVAMTAEEAAALENTLESRPDDVDAREKLIIFYDQAGKVSWEEKLAGIRRHSLWRLQHLPETDLWIPNISKRYDPDGYAEAKRLWLEQTSRPDVTAKTLGRAAAFMTAYDKPVAEELLLRAHRMEQTGTWASRLGNLYAAAVVGAVDSPFGADYSDNANSAFAVHVRRKLEQTTDPAILAAAGEGLTTRYRRPSDTDSVALGRQLLERALEIAPQNARARSMLSNFVVNERRREIERRLSAAGGAEQFNEFKDSTYAAVSALSETDRLFYLPGAAEIAYMRAESVEYTSRDKPEPQRTDGIKRSTQGFARARRYATDAVALAERHRQAPDYGDVVYRAHTVLAVLALKDGKREAAVSHMASAAAASAPETGQYTPHFGLRARLVEYLLREGERESVAHYVEKSAERFPAERERLLSDAKQIRAGVMPLSYQYAEARR